MYFTVKQQAKHLSLEQYENLRELCHIAKNLANQAIYNVRQYYFQEGEYLNYEKNYALLKTSENYKLLNSNMAQQILKEVDGSFKSFFGLLKLAKKGRYAFKDIRLPHYLPKDGFTTLVIGFVRLNGNQLVLPYSNAYRKTHQPITVTIPPILVGKKIKEIRIIPKANARFFELQYTYEADIKSVDVDKNHALALDFGVNNLVTGVTDTGKSFIIDGRRLKSINQWYHKRMAYLQTVKDKQHLNVRMTKQQAILTRKRNRQVDDYIHKTAKLVIDYCIANRIGILVVGYNETFQVNSDMGPVNNQNFVSIPFGKLRAILECLCQLYGIVFVKQEESYTSKASFWDKDSIPVYNADNPQSYTFSGKRIKHGLYQTKAGYRFNADCNGALNILRKSNVVSLTGLYSRGAVDTPVRIRVA